MEIKKYERKKKEGTKKKKKKNGIDVFNRHL
jgi:hypothetical protein